MCARNSLECIILSVAGFVTDTETVTDLSGKESSLFDQITVSFMSLSWSIE